MTRNVFRRLVSGSSRPYFNFISKRSGPFPGEARLSRDRVYILPTRHGVLFGALLAVLLVGSINYEKSLGFMLTFLLAAVGHNAMLATWRNLAGLKLKAQPATAVFSGETARFVVQLVNESMLDRYAISIQHQDKDGDTVDCAGSDQALISFDCPGRRRGRLYPGRFKLYSQYPMGLFVAWTWIDLSMQAIVYPSPARLPPVITSSISQSGDLDQPGPGQDNFSHLRNYHRGDSLRHVSWKAAAKSSQMLTKQFSGAGIRQQWIDWFDIDATGTEHRLSIMAALVISAQQENHHYGLRLPGQAIEPDSGQAHYHQCLRALALYRG
jgi:uncharacterized protein (DUF58 family)